MTNGTSYTDEEVTLLAHGPLIVMMATTTADGITPLGLIRESAAVAGFLTEAQDKYTNNLLVLLVIDRQDEIDKALLEDRSYDDLLAMVDDLGGMLLEDQDTAGYKQFLLD